MGATLPPQQPAATAEAHNSQLNQTWAHARSTLLRRVQTAATSAVFATPPTPKTDAFFATDNALGAVTPGGLYKHQSKASILKSSVSFCLNHFSTTNTCQRVSCASNHAHHRHHHLPDHSADHPAALLHGIKAATRSPDATQWPQPKTNWCSPRRLVSTGHSVVPSLKRLTRAT